MGFIIKNGYPYLEELGENVLDFTSPPSEVVFQQRDESNEGYPYLKTLNLKGFERPTPDTIFAMDDEVNEGYPYLNQSYQKISAPFPDTVFISQNQSKPFLQIDCGFKQLGCGIHSKINKIKFPSTLKSVGEYAFTYSQLTEVTIPSSCSYYEKTSFPENCEVRLK